MDQKPINPLSKHFRQPAIYIKLPSNGRFWPQDAIELPVTGELPVYPMTARDEITIRTPDALLNGQGVVDVIHSCCPNIKDAWRMPSVDVDAVLLNIRIASYGNNMDFDSVCPNCKEENTYVMDMSVVVDQIQVPNYDIPLEVDGLLIKLKPQPYFEINKINQVSFTEQQILRTINNEALSDEEKREKSDEYLKKLIDLNIVVATNSTESITTEDGTVVSDINFIKEFYDMADFKILRAVQDRLQELGGSAELKPIDAKCKSCETDYTIPMAFDYANFFGQGF